MFCLQNFEVQIKANRFGHDMHRIVLAFIGTKIFVNQLFKLLVIVKTETKSIHLSRNVFELLAHMRYMPFLQILSKLHSKYSFSHVVSFLVHFENNFY